MSFSLPVNVAILFSFNIFLLFLLGLHRVFTSNRENDCEMTYMFEYPQFVEISLPLSMQKKYPKYTLYGYGEGGITEQLRKMKFKGIPVIFIPGSSGSYKQGRSLASVSLRKSLNSRTPFHFNYFMVDFNEEEAAIYGGVLQDQTNFVVHCIKHVLSLYENNEKTRKPNSVILIGHSMGGLVGRGVFMNPEFDSELVQLVISLATPHKYPLFQPDYYVTSYYNNLKNYWKNHTNTNNTLFISIGGGLKDVLVHSDVVQDSLSHISVVTSAVPGVWLLNDHLSIMWCKQLIITLVRALFDSVDLSTKFLASDKNYIKNVFQYHLIQRNAGKKFPTSHVNRFYSFEKTSNWFENLQRQFTVTEAKGLNSVHYIMIRLFSDSNSEAAFIETYNVNVKDWIYVCKADVVVNSIRMCDSGENLSNLTQIAPVNMNLRLKRKFVYLNLLELKSKSFSHVIIRLPPSNSFMSVNVDVHQPTERNLNYKVPKYYSFSSETIIEKTIENANYYSVKLIGFENIWQSFDLKVEATFCKSEKNQAVVSFVTPWANEDQHFVFKEKNFLLASLNLITPKPKNTNTSYPTIYLHLDPTCRYEVTIQTSLIGMFAQGARYYSLMLPAFIGTVAILSLRQQIKHLNEGKCVLYHSALSSAVRPYYIVLQVSVLGSKLLGLGFFLLLLPEPDFLTLQELNLDSFFLTVLLYAVAIATTYLLGGAIYLGIVLSGQAAQKLALRVLARSISGLFNCFEFVLSTLHQLPFIVAVLLISLSFSTTGALALCVGAFFYFLKLCKMYEDYLDNWIHFSVEIIAKKIIGFIIKKLKIIKTKKVVESKEVTKSKNSQEEKIENTEEESKPDSEVTKPNSDDNEKEKETDELAVIHFHVSVFVIWFLIAALYVPTLLTWVKNYHYSTSLEKDPAFIPSLIVCGCSAFLWQSDVPKANKKLTMVTSSSLFLLGISSIIYSTLSLYRLGYLLSFSLLIITLNQVLSNYM